MTGTRRRRAGRSSPPISTPSPSPRGLVYGEIIGIPEGLWLWYGTDLSEANRVLTTQAATKAQITRKGEIYRQILSLLLAGRRPAYYLIEDHAALAALTDNYLRLLAAAGIIDAGLRDAALHRELHFRADIPRPPAMSFVGNKATDRIRAKSSCRYSTSRTFTPSTGSI